jgi:hypothetical protein
VVLGCSEKARHQEDESPPRCDAIGMETLLISRYVVLHVQTPLLRMPIHNLFGTVHVISYPQTPMMFGILLRSRFPGCPNAADATLHLTQC